MHGGCVRYNDRPWKYKWGCTGADLHILTDSNNSPGAVTFLRERFSYLPTATVAVRGQVMLGA